MLVADDEPIERMIVGRTIKKYFSGQLEVVEAVNGREAVKFFTEKDCKIALLDIEMPGVNGLEAAEQIREEDRDCSIIFLTAFDEFSYAKRAISPQSFSLSAHRPPPTHGTSCSPTSLCLFCIFTTVPTSFLL